jgi:mRNA-degrading endonuclease HigB of HigAB toxin-antitoxin module
MGRIKFTDFELGCLVKHRIIDVDGFQLGMVIGLDYDMEMVHVAWCGGKKSYHIPEMLKRIETTN